MDLIVGVTGTLGREIAKLSTTRGRRVRGLIRESSRADRVRELEALGVQLTYGDLKIPATLPQLLEGVDTVISTASATNSQTPGDSIETVDGAGQLALIDAARAAGARRFVFVSFPVSSLEFSLQSAKRKAEERLVASGMSYTILQPPNFLEIWFSEALGFDAKRRSARLFGGGYGKVSFISFKDVARVAVESLYQPATIDRTIRFGGPEALSQRDVVRIFEELLRETFTLEVVEKAALEAQYEQREDPVGRTYAALMLLCGARDEYVLSPPTEWVTGPLVSAREFAEGVVSAQT